LLRRGLNPLPGHLTPHSLRRTFCSILYACGEDSGVAMDDMGHTNPALALSVYRQSMRRGEDEKRRLRALVEGDSQLADRLSEPTENPVISEQSTERLGNA
jgi:integrase